MSKLWKLTALIGSLAMMFLSACTVATPEVQVGTVTVPAIQVSPLASSGQARAQESGREIPVDHVRVEIGFGSPIPVDAIIDAHWPDPCAQLVEMKQTVESNHFEIHLFTTPENPACPPGQAGLPFRVAIPLNMTGMAVQEYTVSVNGETTSFLWDPMAGSSTEPVPTLTPQPPVSAFYLYEGISFALDPSIASSAVGMVVPATQVLQDQPYWEMYPEYVKIELSGYPKAQSFFQPTISVFPREAYRSMNPANAQNVDELAAFLAEKPNDPSHVPFLPVWNAAQVFHSNVRHLNFRSGSGVRFLTLYAQYAAPINNTDLFYTFQGFTADGKYAVSIILPVGHASLPPSANSLTQAEMEAIANNVEYYPHLSGVLSAEADNRFQPDLAQLDALVTSMMVEGAP